MINKRKQKRRLKNSLAKRQKEIEIAKVSHAFRNIFVKAGVLK